MPEDRAQMPLHGIRVVELSGFVMGPHAGVLLGDMGAEVIKVEHPAGGDPGRGMTGVRLPITNLNYMFELDNHGKKSITLDLKQTEGREAFYRLIETADVMLTNFQLKVLKQLGVDYESVSSKNPRLIYALGTGWGLNGPDRDSPAFDFVAFARSGLMATLGEPDTPFSTCLPGLGDHIAAMTLAYGTMLALFNREKTGKGQMVHISLLGSLVEAASLNLQACLTTGLDMPRVSRTRENNPLWNYYETKDRKHVQFAMLQTDRHWHVLCEALGDASLEKDDRFATHRLRCANNRALIAILDTIMRQSTLEEWAARFKGKDIIWGHINTFAQVGNDPQIVHNSGVIEIEHPIAGRTKVVGIPVQLSATPGCVHGTAPELGQHTEEILLDLGYEWDSIDDMKQKKVIL